MIAAARSVEALMGHRPEWSPWLAVVNEVHREAAATRWESVVPVTPGARDVSRPLLAGATVAVDGELLRSLFERIVSVAVRAGTPRLATLSRTLAGAVDPVSIFTASIHQQEHVIADAAAASGADAEALQAIVSLVSVPFLHACNRRWASSLSPGWTEGYCPLCGSWPAFAEVRGIERSRYLRCGRCGGEWYAHGLRCVYCGNSDHDDLATLVPQDGGAGAIEVCSRCRGYVKSFTRLQGCPPAAVMIDDLGSVALDVAALAQGYARPSGCGCSITVTVHEA